jgi:uncharacterized Fe-S cluster-containing radical SAM superfamily enzyme
LNKNIEHFSIEDFEDLQTVSTEKLVKLYHKSHDYSDSCKKELSESLKRSASIFTELVARGWIKPLEPIMKQED